MPITTNKQDARNHMVLEDALDISAAAELKQSLLEALGSGKDLHISLAAVTELDVTAVQLLWAAAREAKSSNIAFNMDAPSPPAIARVLADGGFQEFPFTT